MLDTSKTKWVTIFGNAPSLTVWKAEQYAKNITLTYPVTAPFCSEGMKLRFSNKYTKEPISIHKWAVLKEDENKEKTVIYLNENTITIPNGEEYTTEEFGIVLSAKEKFYIQFYLGDFTNLSSGVYTSGKYSGGQVSEGDFIGKELDPNYTVSTNWNYFLTDVYVRANEAAHTVVCFGDSITAQEWPDDLYRRILNQENNNTAIIRKAVSGTRLLRQYDCNKYRSYGIKGETRFEHECSAPGADIILIQHGINDIIHPVGVESNIFRPWSDLPTAEEMIEQYKSYISTARKLGKKVLFGTLLPIEGWRTYADFREELRLALNDWIRTTELIDGVVDFDKAVRDEANIHAFREGFDSGDHLHPSLAAYDKMGECAFDCLKD